MERLIGSTRRRFCQSLSLGAVGFLSARSLALADPTRHQPGFVLRKPAADAVIILWLGGGPSQLETFDPHPGTEIGGPTQAIPTAVKGIQIAAGLPRVAEQMGAVTLIRSLVSKEGEHERGRYTVNTGSRPNPTLLHPALGSIVAHQLPKVKNDLPPFVSILSEDRLQSGGYLGEDYNPFRVGAPGDDLPDVNSRVEVGRRRARDADWAVIEQALTRRNPRLAERTQHATQFHAAQRMMDSTHLTAFDVTQESLATRALYGDTVFGRGCLVARRLVESGVRAVEIELSGFDSHARNFSIHENLNRTLDVALAGLLADLAARDRLRRTLVLCVGEFGRTPKINGLDGRDHWTRGFSALLAGGPLAGGRVWGETDPTGSKDPKQPVSIDDFFATVLASLGINPGHEEMTSIGRPVKLSEGKPIAELFA